MMIDIYILFYIYIYYILIVYDENLVLRTLSYLTMIPSCCVYLTNKELDRVVLRNSEPPGYGLYQVHPEI